MAVIRLAALVRLKELIEAAVPELAGHVCAGPASYPHGLTFPSLGIHPIRFRYYPDQAALHAELTGSTAVFNVGRVEATVQLRLGASTPEARAALEDAIMQGVFWADLDRPGVVALTLPEFQDAVIAYELDDDEWDDEKAFDRKWYSTMACALQMPALVTKADVPTVHQIRLMIAEDLNATTADAVTYAIGPNGPQMIFEPAAAPAVAGSPTPTLT